MINYDPTALLKKYLPKKRIKKVLGKNLTVKRTALNFVDSLEFIEKGALVDTALKVVKSYKERVKADAISSSLLKRNPKQLIQRMENAVLTQISEGIKEKYKGEKYEWLPSDAQEPDPEHQLNYGEIFTIGEGEMPGDRFGCRCGMRIITNDSELRL